MTRALVLALALVGVVACGAKPAAKPADPPPPIDHRTPLEQRRDAACDQLQPRLTECAIADAKASLTPEQYQKLDPEQLRGKHKQEFLKQCKGSAMSSRQVRVLEVCHRAESECGPLADCLANLNKKPSS